MGEARTQGTGAGFTVHVRAPLPSCAHLASLLNGQSQALARAGFPSGLKVLRNPSTSSFLKIGIAS